MTNYNLIAYLVYLPVAILMTIAVSNVLFKNGKIFMYDIFHQKEDIASATNSLFKNWFLSFEYWFRHANCLHDFYRNNRRFNCKIEHKNWWFCHLFRNNVDAKSFLIHEGRRTIFATNNI